MRAAIISFLFCLSFCLYSFAAVPDGLKHPEAYEKAMGDIIGENQQYTKTIIKYAAQGDKSFQFILGKAYLQGKKMPVDASQAGAWLKRAADNGHPEANMMHALSMLEAEKYEEAHEYLKKAVDAFPGEANYQLGQMYFKGQGVDASRPKSVELTRKAAESGNPAANFFMYKCLFFGVGVSKDTVKAMTYLEKGAEGDHLEAIENIVMHSLSEDGDKADKYLKKAEGLFDDKQEYEDWRKNILSQYAPRTFKNSSSVKGYCRKDNEVRRIASVISSLKMRNPSLSDCKKYIETCEKLEKHDYPASVLLTLEGSRYIFSENAEMLSKGLKRLNGKWVSYEDYAAHKSSAATAAQQRAEEKEKARAEAEKNRPVYVMRDFPCGRCKGSGHAEGFNNRASDRKCLTCKGKGTIARKVLEGSSSSRSSYSKGIAKPKTPTFSKGKSGKKTTWGSSSTGTGSGLQ